MHGSAADRILCRHEVIAGEHEHDDAVVDEVIVLRPLV